jgi:hypothetical protein
MSFPFLTRPPRDEELTLLKKFLASYRDGSGNLRESDGSTRAEFRQIERCFAELLFGKTTENKAFYDFVVQKNEDGGVVVRGASIKSKEHENLNSYISQTLTMRSHLELSNSSAKDWKMCMERGLSEKDFREGQQPDKFGAAILERQAIERTSSQESYLNSIPGKNKAFKETDSVYISLLYSPVVNGERTYLVSSFGAVLPKPATWEFKGKRLVGQEADGSVLYEWYGLSGGQLKYYPKLSQRLHGTSLFNLADYKPAIEDLRAKANRMFG